MSPNSLIKELHKQSDKEASLVDCESLVESLESELKRHTTKSDRQAVLRALASFQKSVRAAKRKANSSERKRWESVLNKVEIAKLLAEETQDGDCDLNDGAVNDSSTGLPRSLSEYTARLKKQKKEIYKNPPVMPPGKIVVYESRCSPPKRDQRNRLVFSSGESKSIEPLLKDFRPNQTPEDVLRGGAFGGTYFRTIASAVTGETYNGKQALADTVPSEWIDGLDVKRMLTSSSYHETVNKYRVKCGGSLGMWESSGWISNVDPYGWFQWYCRFYQGRRCSDDFRQVSRWLKIAGPKGRFKSQLCNKILAANARAEDASISPVIRQTLFHWGLHVDNDVVEAHRKSR